MTLQRTPKQFRSLPKYPTVKRDISLVVPDELPAGDLLVAIRRQSQKYLESAEIFDVVITSYSIHYTKLYDMENDWQKTLLEIEDVLIPHFRFDICACRLLHC